MYCIGVLKNIHLADFWKPILLFIAQLSAFLSSQSPHTTLLNQQARQITHKLYEHFTLLTSFGRAARTLLFGLNTRQGKLGSGHLQPAYDSFAVHPGKMNDI
jgi:hypothetical protein